MYVKLNSIIEHFDFGANKPDAVLSGLARINDSVHLEFKGLKFYLYLHVMVDFPVQIGTRMLLE